MLINLPWSMKFIQFRIKKRFNQKLDGVIWTKEVDNPEAYGVVKLNSENDILDLVEKPLNFVSLLLSISTIPDGIIYIFVFSIFLFYLIVFLLMVHLATFS